MAEGLDRTPAGSSKEPARVTRYLARPPTRLADEVTKWSSHDLQVCVQGKGHLVRAGWTGRFATDQTWTLAGEQCDRTRSSEAWKAVISSRGTDDGSGRKRPAEKEAFAMAIWWEAMAGLEIESPGSSKAWSSGRETT